MANGDEIHYSVYLAKGTYTFGMLYLKTNANGIIDIYIDADEVASFDSYSAGNVFNSWGTQANIVVAASGLKTINFKIDGKNGASSNYYTYTSYLVFWRTA